MHACIDVPAYRADCKGLFDEGQDTSGVYKVQPDDLEPFDVSQVVIIVLID